MLLWIKSLNFVVVFCILFLLILLSHVAKLGGVFPILVEGGLPLNVLLERCLDFIIVFHLLFLLWVPLSLSFSTEHSWSLKVSRRAFIFCCSACWFTFTYVSAGVLVGLLFLLPFFASLIFSPTRAEEFLLIDSLLHGHGRSRPYHEVWSCCRSSGSWMYTCWNAIINTYFTMGNVASTYWYSKRFAEAFLNLLQNGP